ncbi:MAG: PAS domain-containing sensor histidine kinase [Candidatus Sulfotelmatobacter sp.]
MPESHDKVDTSTMHGVGIESTQVLEGLPDGITIQDREFTVIYQNQAMVAAFGNKLGIKCYSAYEKRDEKCEGCGVFKVFQTGQPTLVLRTAFDAQGGTSYWENACFPIRDEAGNVVAAAEVCRNITGRVGLEDEVKQRNIELGQLNKQLQNRSTELSTMFRQLEKEVEQRERAEIDLRQAQKLQAVGQLAAGIAHEINTPTQFVGDNIRFLADSFEAVRQLMTTYRQAIEALAAAPGYEALAQKVREAEEAADLAYLEEATPAALREALDGILRISTIVSAMKEFAHPDQREKSPADLNRALQVALTIARNEYRCVADVETDFGELPPVTCHLGGLNQVFLNLFVNAAHAISEVVAKGGNKGRIRVRTKKLGDKVRIDIADTGCGIPEAIRERVFEPFFTTKEVGRGSGQGLAIARSVVVDKHGRSLTFESEVGTGTTFTIWLPVNGSSAAPVAPTSTDLAIRALTASLHNLT